MSKEFRGNLNYGCEDDVRSLKIARMQFSSIAIIPPSRLAANQAAAETFAFLVHGESALRPRFTL